eukprot:TRINITY_DN5498_c0_g2_i2.p1 TRINITY_DN5498_c0_g2~~TRINITY_DN5498_c0_g2_i2.p1  ORF type:complete len:317 (+),score=51.92 TRINITY_DN5498_c0_g2_i2:67-1017(+)
MCIRDRYVAVWGFSSGHGPLNHDVIQKGSLQIPSVGQTGVADCVQSVCLNKESLLIGTKSGIIYAVDVLLSLEDFKTKAQSDGSLFRKVLDAVDGEIPKCISYDSRNKRLLCISQKGFLSVWSLETKMLVAGKAFDKPALYIYSFVTVSGALVAFENEVNMLNDHYDILEGYSIKKSLITAIKVCSDEKTIVLASSNAKTSEVEIYDIENKFQEFHSIKVYKANIVNIYFTTDDKTFICQSELGDIYIYNRETLERIETTDYTKDLHWEGFGLTTDKNFEEISKYYSNSNKIHAISRFPKRKIVAVGDEIGSVTLS